jgi:hypothetical protein
VAVAVGVEDLELGAGMGALAAHDQPRALKPGGEVDLFGELFGQGHDRLTSPGFHLVADREAGGTTHAVKVTATVTGITYTCAPTFTCTLGGISHHGNNSTYDGTVTMTAFEDKEGLPTPVSEGARTPLTWS